MKKRFISRCFRLLALSGLTALCSLPASCDKEDANTKTIEGRQGYEEVLVVFQNASIPELKSADPDENKISDINLFIFNSEMLLEKHLYIRQKELIKDDDGSLSYNIKLLKNCRYTIYACANIGFKMPCRKLDELLDYTHYMAYPDEYRNGMAMSGQTESFEYSGGDKLVLELSRSMAKISIKMDRSALDKDVEFIVHNVEICSCPRSVKLFADNAVRESRDIHSSGFMKSHEAASSLNEMKSDGTSGEICLYMFENLQGKPLGELFSYDEKLFAEDDPHSWQCSYIEMKAEYRSDRYSTQEDKSLIYRFYLGAGVSDFDVRRNSYYHITIKPKGDGLHGLPWRIDSSGIIENGTF